MEGESEVFEVDKSCPVRGCNGELENKGNYWECNVCGEIFDSL